MTLARTAIVALALAAAAWFAVGVQQAHDLARASNIISSAKAPTAAQARRAQDLLRSAGSLNPDLQVDVLRGQLALDEGHLTLARQLLFGVIRREPKLIAAWELYARASVHDPVAFFAAEIGIRRLVRLFPASR